MGIGRVIVGLVMFAGCGRFGFSDEVVPPDGTVAPPGDAAPPTLLRCDQPTRTPIGAADAVSAFGTSSGVAMIASSAGAIHGWTFAITPAGDLVPIVQAVALGTSATNQIAATASGPTILVSAIEGMPATGTVLATFDPTLASDAAPSHRAGELAVTGPVAPASPGFAYVTENAATREVDARLVDTSGEDVSALAPIVPGADKASEPSIVRAGSGYALIYTATATTPNEARVELLDASFAVTTAAVKASTSAFDPEHPQVSYAAGSSTYLVTWMEKGATTDEIWMALFGSDLQVIVAAKQIALKSYDPSVATDGTGFWIVWNNYSAMPNFLDGVHVTADGTVTPRPVTMTGADATHWAMLDRFGQPLLVYTETGGTDLVVDPMCN